MLVDTMTYFDREASRRRLAESSESILHLQDDFERAFFQSGASLIERTSTSPRPSIGLAWRAL
jgi:hypothetical protein